MCVDVLDRFTSSDTHVETVVLPVRVVDPVGGLVQLGGAPLLVPQVYGLSNAIDSSVLVIRTGGDLICTVRLLQDDTGVPGLGRLVREAESTARKGGAPADETTAPPSTSGLAETFVSVLHQADRRIFSVQETSLVPTAQTSTA